MDLLDCTIMPYAWGSRDAIATLTGRPSSDGPEAELWMGAHPIAPSSITRDGRRSSLDAIVAADPSAELGAAVVRELGPRFPFLLKVLAAAEPLSLQAHPTAAQARAGFDDEERRSIPLGAPTRNYKDPSHKPELLCALGPFEALSGFRDVAATLRLFDQLSVGELAPALAPLRASPDGRGLAQTFAAMMTMPVSDRARVVDATARACTTAATPEFARECRWAARLAARYPGDIGAVSALLLQLVHLEAGDAIYLGAGNLHAYLRGTGVEIMASSDNVLRGGLTTKHVDVAELLRVLDFDAGPAPIVRPRVVDAQEAVYDTPAREFRLSRLDVTGSLTRRGAGPEILFVVEGELRTGNLLIPKGRAAFLSASAPSYTIAPAPGKRATVYRATTNLDLVP